MFREKNVWYFFSYFILYWTFRENVRDSKSLSQTHDAVVQHLVRDESTKKKFKYDLILDNRRKKPHSKMKNRNCLKNPRQFVVLVIIYIMLFRP